MKSQTAIERILNITSGVLGHSKSKRFEFPKEFTFIHVLERVQCNLISLQTLLEDGISKHEHVVGLVSRNILSDFITTGHIILSSNEDSEFDHKLFSLYYSDLCAMDRMVDMYHKHGLIQEKDYQAYIENDQKDSSLYSHVKTYALENKLKEFPQVRQIIESFINNKKDGVWPKEIINSYSLWILYSKYEHLGWHSYNLTRLLTKKDNNNRIKSVLFKATILIGSCCELLEEKTALKEALGLIEDFKSQLNKKNH